MKKVILGIIWSISFFSCQKDIDPLADIELSFDFPFLENSDSLEYLDTLNCSGSISANAEMHGYEITIKDTQNTVIEHIHEHLDDVKYEIQEYWINDMNSTMPLTVTFRIYLSHDSYDPIFKERQYECIAKGK